MNFLKKLFGFGKKKNNVTLESSKQIEDAEANSSSAVHSEMNGKDDNLNPEKSVTDQENDKAKQSTDTFEGVTFSATLNTNTPLQYLLLDQQTKSQNEADKLEAPLNYGLWLPNTALENQAIKSTERDSQFGPVPLDGGKVLPELIAFRTIMERPLDLTAKDAFLELEARALNIVAAAPSLFIDTIDCFGIMFREMIVDIKHLSNAHLIELIHTGYTSIPELKTLKESNLKALKGIGPKKAQEIIEQLSKIK